MEDRRRDQAGMAGAQTDYEEWAERNSREIKRTFWSKLFAGGTMHTKREIGRELETYESMEELEQKVRYYLSHEDERIEIALNGYEKVAALHTYEIRVAEMIRVLNSLL